MAKSSTSFNKKTGSKGGKKSRRKPLDQEFRALIMACLEEIVPNSKKLKKQLMVDAAFKEFISGNYRPMAYIIDRAFGKPKDNIELSGPDGGPIESNINYDRPKEETVERTAEILKILSDSGALKKKPKKKSNPKTK